MIINEKYLQDREEKTMAKSYQANELSGIIKINEGKCKGCDTCKSFCPADAIDGAYGANHRVNNERCLQCGQCLVNCPFGAIEDTVDVVDQVIEKLRDKDTTVVATVAPAVRVALGEEFGMEPGKLITEQMYGALKAAGFKIMDVNFAADIFYLSSSLIAVLFLYSFDFFDDYIENSLVVCEYIFVVGYLSGYLFQLVHYLLAFHTCQATQCHLCDMFSLNVRQTETCH